ncbi:DUF3152 domain-containing protein [Millisia brevis]|uniref:DUF3152 domain-containing protein n=1 Tax=Millisia brevis TaxID=264148 RepID=UPI000833E02D|nr:DUF3152 domain-containing protein [Millisia brevis]
MPDDDHAAPDGSGRSGGDAQPAPGGDAHPATDGDAHPPLRARLTGRVQGRPALSAAVVIAVGLLLLGSVAGARSILVREDVPPTEARPAASEPATVASLITAGARVDPADQHLFSSAAAQDSPAGVLSRVIPWTGTGELSTVAGTPGSPVPPGPRHLRVRVETEVGLPVDATRFADFAIDVLNDPRGWGGRGYTFERTDGSDAAFELILASPDTSERMCAPLGTFGTMSCRAGNRVILTWYRWAIGIPDYGTAVTDYRRYVVNHEVGHYLGFGHVFCPGVGQPAPLMMQQTKGLDGCLPNPWP